MFDAYVIVDVEATCDVGRRLARADKEIIEIGAVRVPAPALTPADEYQSFVRPVRHPTLSSFCTGLTSVSQQDVDRAPTFPEALAGFTAWMYRPGGRVAFCSWGDYDRKQVLQDCQYHRIAYPMPEDHLNLKVLFSRALGLNKRLSLLAALAEVGLEPVGRHHRGIDDARSIARLLPYALRGA